MKFRELIESKGIYLQRVGSREYYTYWTRPKKAENVECESSIQPETAILIQGPIKYEDDFTFETVKLYKKMFPQSPLIVSTWSNEDKDVLRKIEEEGARVCLSDPPDPDSVQNYSVNLQLKNTKKGIELAKQEGYLFCAKTRSDQRIYSWNALSFCRKMIEMFPVEDKEEGIRGRILTTSMGTFDKRLYNISDLFLFGYTDDMLLYYSCPEDLRDHRYEKHPDDFVEYSKLKTGEIWFSTCYMEAIGHKLLWTKQDSEEVMRDYFIIIDAESIDLFWAKYTKREYRWRTYTNEGLKPITYSDWFLMYCDR